jgi:chromate reductase
MASGNLLGICGSLRAGSYNRKLLREAVRIYDPADYAEADLRLPLYDGDLEAAEGIPAVVQDLADQIADSDAVVISGPEYNKGLSGVLKNALDWVSRTQGNPWRDKPVAVMAATGGRAGGERTQWTLRLCLTPFRPRLLAGPDVLVGNCSDQFDENGRLVNARYEATLSELMAELRKEASRV